MEHTRPIMWNVDDVVTKTAMYGLFVVSLIFLAYGVYRRIRVWRRGQGGQHASSTAPGEGEPTEVRLEWGAAFRRLFRHVVAQVRIARIPWAYFSHMGVFYGFIVLFIGTVIVGLEHYGIFALFGISFSGPFYDFTSFWLDVFGLIFLVALVVAMVRRVGLTRIRPSSKPIDAVILWLFLVIGATGFVVEALRIHALQDDWESGVSFAGYALAAGFSGMGLSIEGATTWHFVFWWFHMVLVFVFIAMIPYTKLLHFLVAPVHIARTPEIRSGRLKPVSLEEVEETGRFGLAEIQEFSWPQLMSYDACTHCRRCETACPAYATNKPLSPMRVILDIAAHGEHEGTLHQTVISNETLWSCTTCGACVHECPVLIDQMGTIVEMRRHLVGEGQVVGSSQAALRSIAATGNPWGLPADERTAWAEGLEVPTVDENPTPDVLLWVGCAGSYDRRNQQVTRALTKILKAAGINYSILGKKERCTGDPARRIGDEFTFMEQAQANVDTLSKVPFQRVVTPCAHCFNTLKNEYPDFGGNYQVSHHTEFVREMIDSGRIQLDEADGQGPITLHDPCYLSRHNDSQEAPRGVLGALAGPSLPIVEPEKHGRNTFCCGAGGGRMWMEEDIDKRVNFARWDQLKATGAKTVAVGCPFCMTMLDDAAKNDEASGVAVQDIAELVAARLVER